MNEIVLPPEAREKRRLGPTFEKVFNDYLDYNSGSLTESSRESYRGYMVQFFRWTKAKHVIRIQDLRTDHIAAFMAWCINEKKFRGGVVLLRVKFLRRVCNWAVEEGIIPVNPVRMAHLPKLRKQKPDKHPISYDQYQRLMVEFGRHPQHFTEWVPACTIAWHTGLRMVDIANLKWTSVLWEQEYLNIEPQKLHAYRQRIEIPIEPELMQLFRQLKAQQAETFESEWVLWKMRDLYHMGRTVVAMFSRIRDRCPGMERISFHSFRHAFVTRLLNAGCAPIVVGSMTGQSLQQLEEYAHISLDAKAQAFETARKHMHIAKLKLMDFAPEPYAFTAE